MRAPPEVAEVAIGRGGARARRARARSDRPARARTLGAVSIYLLAVVVAAAVGGLWAGSGASVLSLWHQLLLHRAAPHVPRPPTPTTWSRSWSSSSSQRSSVGVVARALRTGRAPVVSARSRLLNLPSDQGRCRRDDSSASSRTSPARCSVRSTSPGARSEPDRRGSYDVVQSRDRHVPGRSGACPRRRRGGVRVARRRPRRRPEPSRSPRTSRLLEAAARQIALALERAGLDAR